MPAVDRVVTVQKLIAADAAAIFELLARPSRHSEVDGSGMVKAPHGSAPDRLTLGGKFTMTMRRWGVTYRITSTVIEFDEDRRIAWRHFGRHVWRYILEPAEGGTLVTEQFDWGASVAPFLLKALRYPETNRDAMVATLDRMAAIVVPSSTA